MTSKDYCKHMSDMSYPLKDVAIDEDDDTVIGNIALTHGETRDAADKILNENSFFSLPYYIDADQLADSETLEIRFHYGIDNVDCYHLNINGIVDCRTANAGEPVADGKLVLACEGWKLVKSIRPKEDGDAEDTDGDSSKEPLGKSRSIFDLFDDIVGCSSCLSDLFRFPSFPKFPDISNMIEETRKNIEKGIEKSKGGDGNVKFYDFSCRIDPDGKVHLKRSSNDGTVEKEFKLGDGSEKAKKIEVKDSDDPKTELKSLVK